MYKVHKKDDTYIYCIERVADRTMIPLAPANTDYQQFLAWCAEGNTPLPADEQGEQA